MQIIKYNTDADIGLGIYDNMPPDIYRVAPGVSRSTLVDISRSIKYWLEKPRVETKAMAFGTLIHDVLMFPENIKNYAFELDIDRRKKEGKELYEKFLAESTGKIIIPKAVGENEQPEIILNKILSNIENNKYVKKFLDKEYCKFELSFFWNDQSEVRCKCRPDILFRSENIIFCLDIKTCQDASYDSFRYDIKKRKYHIQASYYSEGIKQCIPEIKKVIFCFIAIETQPPYDIAIYDLDQDTMDQSKPIWKKSLAKYKTYLENKQIIGYDQGLKTISLNDWEL